MRSRAQIRKHNGERGVALLIAIFALLLVSVVAIALIISSGTDSALAGNYRSSANAYYAAMAGLEEARGRLLPTNGNCIQVPPNGNCNQQPLALLPLNQVFYIINPAPGEVVAPEATGNPATYPDLQYKQEFGVDVSTRAVSKVPSISAMAGLPGPNFKWVRINAFTEQAMGNGGPGVDVDSNGTIDSTIPLFYDPVNQSPPGLIAPGLIAQTIRPPTAMQALEITSLAVLPGGTQKMLQYIVRPLQVYPSSQLPRFTAALTLAGPNVQFTGPGSSNFYIRGQDQCVGSLLMVPAIGYTTDPAIDTSYANIVAGATPASNYQGTKMNPGPPAGPSIAPDSIQGLYSATNTNGMPLNTNWMNPIGLDAIVRDITDGADAVIQGPATPGSFPPGMSPTHPMTIVVKGDLDLSSWNNTGYGLLLVTGTLYYDPAATWEGIVLVIGQGNFVSTRHGTGGIDGAVFLAQTRDASGNLLASLGPASFSQTGGGPSLGRGINYNSCLVNSALGPIFYKVLAFKEIPLLN